jgi:DNA-binding IclR family transcriptional regulator
MPEKAGRVNSVEKAFILLECFLDNNEPLSLKEISQRVGLPKSTVHSLLSTMRKQEIIIQNESDGKYSMGIRVFELGNAVSKALDIVNIAKPYMMAIANSISKTIHLTTLRRNQVILIKRTEPVKNPLKIILAVGTAMPLYCTAPGKLFLAYMPESAALEYLRGAELIPYSPNTIIDPDVLLAQLRSIRADGFAVEEGERNVGIHGIAAPIFNHKGKAVYSIGAFGLANSMKTSDFQLAKNKIIQAASKKSGQLGYKNPEKM